MSQPICTDLRVYLFLHYPLLNNSAIGLSARPIFTETRLEHFCLRLSCMNRQNDPRNLLICNHLSHLIVLPMCRPSEYLQSRPERIRTLISQIWSLIFYHLNYRPLEVYTGCPPTFKARTTSNTYIIFIFAGQGPQCYLLSGSDPDTQAQQDSNL